ncbi:hypothetical protein E3E23_05900 [Thermococcus sp. CX2]|uniref:hypothetical protein n=1 Tax=Thermococcus sp. CX2 TaxID=163006 RepID=UPI00143A9479|nr:hypothetical protein [Thermococcus sp. CX2]NJE85354.1 hypothetical protein [Thermococcus sp. CX2]
MRRTNKKRLIPLALALVLALVGTALAVPTITVTVQDLGQGNEIVSSEVTGATVSWNLDTNLDYVDSINVDIAATTIANTAGGTLYVKIYSDTTLIAMATINLDGSTTSFTNVPLTLVNDPNNDGKLGLDEFDSIYVVYEGP